jgi:hypothetical protein
VLAPPGFFTDREGILTAMEIPDSQEAAKFSAVVYVTSDGGQTWKPATSILGTDHATFAFPTSQDWWAWGSAPHDTNSTGPVQGKLYRAGNGDQAWNASGAGVTWTALTPDPGSALGSALQAGYNAIELDFVSANTGWVLLEPPVGDAIRPYILLKTLDGGQTWKVSGQN